MPETDFDQAPGDARNAVDDARRSAIGREPKLPFRFSAELLRICHNMRRSRDDRELNVAFIEVTVKL
jgi:hypothetical protein